MNEAAHQRVLTSEPPDWDFELPGDMAAALGRAVASFGQLEEALKRTIFTLTRKDLGQDASQAELEDWLQRMEDLADDSLGTLVDSFRAAAKQAGTRDHRPLLAQLDEIRRKRNLLCHASWRRGRAPKKWHPTFINTRGEAYPDDMDAADINHIRAETRQAMTEVVAIMRRARPDNGGAG